MTKETAKKYLIWITPFAIPFFLGLIGMLRIGEGELIVCIYKSIQLFTMEYSVETEPVNWMIHTAKFLAPMATVTYISAIFMTAFESVKIRIILKREDTVAIHGNSANIDLIQRKLGKRAIVSDKPEAFRAKKQLLMFDDDVEMYHFIDMNGTKFLHDDEKTIFLCSEKILRGCYEDRKLVVCNIAENCARTYWRDYPVTWITEETENPETGEIKAVKRSERILIIGFDNYGQRLLTQGILKNVISDQSAIEYHICGSYSEDKNEYEDYLDTHMKMHKAVNLKGVFLEKEVSEAGILTEAEKIYDIRPREEICENQDTVYFHMESWQKVMGRRGTSFDRVIVCQDSDAQNMEILNELKTFYVVNECHIKYTDVKILEELWDCKAHRIRAFGINEKLYNPEAILLEIMFDDAKKIHARYFAKNVCKGICDGKSCGNQVKVTDGDGERTEVKSLDCCKNCPVLLEDWNRQNNFIRYSNVAQADHIPVKIRLLLGDEADVKEEGIRGKAAKAYFDLPVEEQEKLWKIEHIRWDRYHFMNNWDYNPKRQNEKRLHHLLIPYEKLDRGQQEKDGDAYRSLAEL